MARYHNLTLRPYGLLTLKTTFTHVARRSFGQARRSGINLSICTVIDGKNLLSVQDFGLISETLSSCSMIGMVSLALYEGKRLLEQIEQRVLCCGRTNIGTRPADRISRREAMPFSGGTMALLILIPQLST